MAAAPAVEYTASQGEDNIRTAAQNASTAENWRDQTMTSMLLGEDSEPAPSNNIWKEEELRRFERYRLPCWVLRYVVSCHPFA